MYVFYFHFTTLFDRPFRFTGGSAGRTPRQMPSKSYPVASAIDGHGGGERGEERLPLMEEERGTVHPDPTALCRARLTPTPSH